MGAVSDLVRFVAGRLRINAGLIVSISVHRRPGLIVCSETLTDGSCYAFPIMSDNVQL